MSKMRDRVQAEANELSARDKGNRFMASKLLEMVENDKINSDYDCNFIRSCISRLDQGLPLTEKMNEYLNKCFYDKY